MSTLSILNLRLRAAMLGYKLQKSNWRKDSIDNLGGYRIVDFVNNTVVDGARFNLDLDDVAKFIAEHEAA